MKHLPSIEALSDPGDERLLAELEIRSVLEKLARVRDVVDRADRLLNVVVADSGLHVRPQEAGIARELYAELLAIVRKKRER